MIVQHGLGADAAILFVGSERGIEGRVVPTTGFRIEKSAVAMREKLFI